MEATDCVFELFGWRTVTRLVAKNKLPYFVPKTPGYTLFCQLPFIILQMSRTIRPKNLSVELVLLIVRKVLQGVRGLGFWFAFPVGQPDQYR